MILHVKEAKYLHDYVIWVKFSDGIEGEIDLEQELTGEIFGPLKDKELFKSLLDGIKPTQRNIFSQLKERFNYNIFGFI